MVHTIDNVTVYLKYEEKHSEELTKSAAHTTSVHLGAAES